MSGPHAGTVWADPLHLFTQSPQERQAEQRAQAPAVTQQTRGQRKPAKAKPWSVLAGEGNGL